MSPAQTADPAAVAPPAADVENDTEGLWGVYAFWSILGLIFFTSVSLFVFAMSQGASTPIPVEADASVPAQLESGAATGAGAQGLKAQ